MESSDTRVSFTRHNVHRNMVLTVMGEIEEVWQLPIATVRMARVRETRIGIAQLIKEWVHHGIDCGETLRGCILE